LKKIVAISPTRSKWKRPGNKNKSEFVRELSQIKHRVTSTLNNALAKAGKNDELELLLKKLQNEMAMMSPHLIGLRDSLQVQTPTSNSLSNLPDRKALEDHFQSNFTQSTGALIYLDIDALKSFNDLLSHVGADQIIEEVALRIAQAVEDLLPEYLGEADPSQSKRQFWAPYLFHLSGDEFAILLPWDVSPPLLRQTSSTLSLDSESSIFDKELTPYGYEFNFSAMSRKTKSVSSMDRGRPYSVLSEQPMSVLSLCESEGMAPRDKRDYIKLYGKNFARAILEAVESPECQTACLDRTIGFLNGAPLPPVTVSAGVAVFNPQTSEGCIKKILNEADLALSRAKSLGASKICTSLTPKQISQNTSKLLQICKKSWDMTSKIPSVVQRGALLNSKDRQGYTALMLCLKHQHFRAATYLSMCIYNPNITNNEGETPLMMAMKMKCDDGLVNLLASKRINTNVVDKNGRSLLNVALDKPFKDVVKILIQKGASGPEILPENWTRAKCAAMCGDLKSLEKVIEDGWHPNNFGRGEGTILNYAAEVGQLGSIKLLVDKKASVNVCTQNGITPLMCAVNSKKNTKEVLSFLVEKKANIEAVSRFNRTCLIMALKKGRWDICRHLTELGANIPSKEDILEHVSKEKTSMALMMIKEANSNQNGKWQRKSKGKPRRSCKAKSKYRRPRGVKDNEARDRRSPRSMGQKTSPLRRPVWSSSVRDLTTSCSTYISILPKAFQDSELPNLELLPPPLICSDPTSRSSIILRASANSPHESSTLKGNFKQDTVSPRMKATTVSGHSVQKSPRPYLAAACGTLKNQVDVQLLTTQQQAPKHEQNNRACNQRQLTLRNHQNRPQQRGVRLMTKPHQPNNQIPGSRPTIHLPLVVQPPYYKHEKAKIAVSPSTENISRFDLAMSEPSSSDESKLKRTFPTPGVFQAPSLSNPSSEPVCARQGHRQAELARAEPAVKRPNWKEIVGRKNVACQ